MRIEFRTAWLSLGLLLCLLLPHAALALEDICDDGQDNDGDTLIDCEDPQCQGKPCEDGDPCTLGDTCDDTGRCTFGDLWCDGRDCPCPSGSICILLEHRCKETLCTDGEDNDADGAPDCGDDDCEGRPCDDGDPCNAGDKCASGRCLGTGYVCNDTDCPCPSGTRCHPSSHNCLEDACTDGLDNDHDFATDCFDPDCDGASCTDAYACTVDDRCAFRRCQGTPDDSLCSDNVACTGDRCDVTRGCIHWEDNSRCQDGVFCNGMEICHITRGCEPGPERCPDPGSFCDEDEDRCRETDCADGLDNDADRDFDCEDSDCEDRVCGDPQGCFHATCSNGDCSGLTPDDLLCDDQDPCTEEACDETTGECIRSCVIQSYEDDLAALETKADAAEGKLDALAVSVARMETKADAAEGKLDVLNASVGTLEVKADVADQQRAALEGKSDSLEAKADLLEGKSDALEAKIEDLQTLIEDLVGPLLWEDLLHDKDCIPTLWLPAAQGGSLEEVRNHVASRIEAAGASGDPRANLGVARARLVEADLAYAEGRFQDACRRLSDALRALTTP